MSQNFSSHSSSFATAATFTPSTLTTEQLQEYWVHLEIKPRTLLYLQQLLQTTDQSDSLTLASVATEALAMEKHGRGVLKEGEEFLREEFRTTFIEGLSPHIVDFIRITLGTFAALHVIPLLSWFSWAMTYLFFPGLVLILYYLPWLLRATPYMKQLVQAAGERSAAALLRRWPGRNRKTYR